MPAIPTGFTRSMNVFTTRSMPVRRTAISPRSRWRRGCGCSRSAAPSFAISGGWRNRTPSTTAWWWRSCAATASARRPRCAPISNWCATNTRSTPCRCELPNLSPQAAGLSHMAEGCDEEGIVPASAFDFAPQGGSIWVSSQDVEGEPAQNGEVLGSIVLARAVAVFGKMDVEHPMELVLDAPMTAGDVQQPLGRDVFGQEIVTRDGRIGALTSQASARGDPAHCGDAWKAIEGGQAGVAHDGGASRFAPIVGGTVDLLGCAALARSRKLLRDGREQAPAVGLDCQNIVAPALAHRSRELAVAMQRIGGNDAAVQRQKVQHFQGTCRLVATRRFLLGQSHPGIHRKDVDQVQRRGLSAAFVGAAQGLAIDGHHPGKLEPVGLGKGRHEAAEREFEGLRLEQAEPPAERIVARDAMLQPKEKPQQPFLRMPEVRHIRARLRSAQRRRQRDEQHLQQIVPGIVRARVRQPPKGLLELLHPTPSMIWESSSESVLPSNAIASENPYAIPLPHAGRGESRSLRVGGTVRDPGSADRAPHRDPLPVKNGEREQWSIATAPQTNL